MRYQKTGKLFISKDQGNDPKNIRFSTELDHVDLTAIKDLKTRSETFAVGVHTIDMANITTGKLLMINPSKDITIKLSGGTESIKVLGGKVTEMWIEFTALEITTTVETEIELVIGGE